MYDSSLTPSGDFAECEVIDDHAPQFFAPMTAGVLDGLFGAYRTARQHINELAGIIAGDLSNVIHYFIDGNCGDERLQRSLYVDKMFRTDGAVAALNAAYWSKAMHLTDVLQAMPQARRDEWHKAIKEHKTPEFEEATVRATMGDLLNSRQKFFAEKVDGIFRALSRSHVTNCPEGFSKRMILAYALNCYGHADLTQCGHINDLRAVIAQFMGRDEPRWGTTSSVVETALRSHRGQWVTLDGGALRLRVYKCGTAHLEVHPLMAYRLNQVLAYLHPAAIPSQFRTKPKRQPRDFVMMGRPLPFRVVEVLARMRVPSSRADVGGRKSYTEQRTARTFDFSTDAALQAEALRVLEAIGGAQEGKGGWVRFDYDPGEVLHEIITTGCIPDRQAHQFYPTPEAIAREAAELADIGDAHSVLEPSAGQGDLAAVLPADRLTCVEISPLHCAILRTRGHRGVHEADFIKWADDAQRQGRRWDRIVMNPPFSDGRAQAHIEAAAQLLAPGGRLVAVLPAGVRGKEVLPGLRHEWSGPHHNAFAGTSVSVAILVATREQ
jgi:hypothetical protein